MSNSMLELFLVFVLGLACGLATFLVDGMLKWMKEYDEQTLERLDEAQRLRDEASDYMAMREHTVNTYQEKLFD